MELSEEATRELEKLPWPEVRRTVAAVLAGSGRRVASVRVRPGSSAGDGLMALVFRVEALFEGEGGAAEGGLRVVVKTSPENAARRAAFSVPLLFVNERAFYAHSLPLLEAALGRRWAAPRFLGGVTGRGAGDALVLQDLAAEGFALAERRAGLDAAHCALVLEQLAALHAASLLLQSSGTPLSGVRDLFWDADRKEAFEPFVRACYAETVRAVRPLFAPRSACVARLERVAALGYDLIAGIVRGEGGEGAPRVLTHGDCWTNNLLFRRDAQGRPLAVRLLDFQLCRLSTPALDLTYFLFTSPRCRTLTQNYSSLLDTYHAALARELSQHGLSADRLFSRDTLDAEMARTAPYGLAMAGIVVPAVFVPPEHTPDMEKVRGETQDHFVQEYARQMQADTPETAEQLAALLQHCEDKGFLDRF